jgi:hypothetical protein
MATHKHPNFELISRWSNDTTLRVWVWDRSSGLWESVDPKLLFKFESNRFFIGHIKPTEPPPPRCCHHSELSFTEPLMAAPAIGTVYYSSDLISGDDGVPLIVFKWNGCYLDRQRLNAGTCHLDQSDAFQHIKALRSLNFKMISEAK